MKPVKAIDAAFLQLETRDTPMHVGALFVLEPGSSRAARTFFRRFKAEVGKCLGLSEVFTRRIAALPLDVANPMWITASPDLDYLDFLALPATDPVRVDLFVTPGGTTNNRTLVFTDPQDLENVFGGDKWDAFQDEDRRLKKAVADAKVAVEREKRNVALSVGQSDDIETLTGEMLSKSIDLNLTIGGEAKPFVMTLRKYEPTGGSGPRMVSRWFVQSLVPKG